MPLKIQIGACYLLAKECTLEIFYHLILNYLTLIIGIFFHLFSQYPICEFFPVAYFLNAATNIFSYVHRCKCITWINL